MTESLLTVPEVAERLRIGQRTVYRMVKEHRLSYIRVEGQLRIPTSALEDYLTAGTVTAVPR